MKNYILVGILITLFLTSCEPEILQKYDTPNTFQTEGDEGEVIEEPEAP